MVDPQYTIEFEIDDLSGDAHISSDKQRANPDKSEGGNRSTDPGNPFFAGANRQAMRVNCAVAVVVLHRRRVLFGKRRTRDGGFEWQLPGGWIEAGESPQRAARREVFEETGIELLEPKFIGITSNVFADDSHSLSLYFEAECADEKALVTAQPEKCLGWEWKYWADLSGDLFLPLRLLSETGYRPFTKDSNRTWLAI
jgi:8-oxo-dGTP pyrophosphatase MutT (NUDIX family)